MSKAFTRESDLPDSSDIPRPISALPAGAKNYVTPQGESRLREELEQLLRVERPKAAAGEDEEAGRKLQFLDQRILELTASLDSAEVVAPASAADGIVRFGATVTVEEDAGERTIYRIVGADETDFDRGWVSWMSPIAKALLGRALGERVAFKFPSGEKDLKIVAIDY